MPYPGHPGAELALNREWLASSRWQDLLDRPVSMRYSV